ncbi:reverse transcriptase domain-containing protein [Tanacetum coccineum]
MVMTSNYVTFIASFIPLIMEYLVKISKKARILELKRRHLKITVLISYMSYPSRKIRRIYACTSQETTKIQSPIRRTEFGLHPYQFTYPERRLTMKEMLYKFIDEGNREHEEMSAFIRELRTTNELLFKERNNSLITTRGGKTTTQGILNDNTDIHDKGPSVLIHDKPDAPKEVLVEDEPQKAKEQVVQPSIKVQIPSIPFPRRLRKEKEEAQQRKFLENLKQLHINLPFIEALAQMPKKITLKVWDDEVIFDVDQSIKKPPTEDDECYGIDDLDETINVETQELLRNDQLDSFLLKGLEKSINRADLESCDFIGDESGIDSDLGTPIRHIDPDNTPYSVTQETTRSDGVKNEHLYSASANEIDEKKPELKDLPHHLEYAYLHGDKSFSIIISSKLSEKEKTLLLQVLEKYRGVFAWKMSDIKGISPSFCTHKILMEDDFKPVIQPQRRLNPKVQDVVKIEIVKLLDSGLIYPISDSSWVSPIHVVLKKGGMTVVLNDNNELIPSRTVTGWRVRMPFGLCNAPATFQICMTTIFHDMVEDFMEVFMDDFSVFGNSFNCRLANLDKMLARCEETNLVLNWEKYHFMVKEGILLGHKIFGAGIEVDRAKIDVIAKLPYPTNVKGTENLAVDHLSRLENPDLGVFTKEEIADEFPDKHLMMLKANPNDDEPWLCPDNIMRRCVAGSEILEILAHCHSGPTRGHHSASITGRKIRKHIIKKRNASKQYSGM